jgi:hypothetical protein
MRLRPAIEHLHRSTVDLAETLATIGQRHASDHDVFHMGRLLSERCAGLGPLLEPFLPEDPQDDATGPLADAWLSFISPGRRAVGEASGGVDQPGPILLRDLREAEVEAHACVTDWVIVHQGAMAARDQTLLDACTVGMDETRRIERWLTTRIKESAPQILMGS